MSERPNDLGLEVILEPNVVPKGTVDLRGLDAPPGTTAPQRRVESDGRTFMRRVEPDGRVTFAEIFPAAVPFAAPPVSPAPPRRFRATSRSCPGRSRPRAPRIKLLWAPGNRRPRT